MRKLILLITLLSLCGFKVTTFARDLNASLAHLPILAETPNKGAFVDLVKAIDEVYTEGSINISIYPFARSVHNIKTSHADFHIPAMRNNDVDESKLPYRIVEEKMGTVSFVIYSHMDKIITREMLDQAIKDSTNENIFFPYSILIGRGIESQTSFNATLINDLKQGLLMISKGRVDALIWAQEEIDFIIKEAKLKNINREYWKSFDDVILIPKNDNSDEINKILSAALRKLKNSGKLEKIYNKIHKPYDNWQPYEMDW